MHSIFQRTLISAGNLRRWTSVKSADVAIAAAKGLSNRVVNVPTSDVGPGASKSGNYKNPEYFCYNTTSYHEAEVELLKFRLPQPSSKK